MKSYSSPLFIRLALIFNGFEHFLTSLKVIYAPFIPLLFFTEESYVTGISFLFQTYPIKFLAKPLGTLFFQFLEKRRNLSHLLKISYLGTGFATATIGLVSFYFPSYLKPTLILGGFVQSFFSANEIIGVTKAILDIPGNDRKKRINSWISTSSMLGIWFAFCSVVIFDFFELLKISFFITHMLGVLLIVGFFCLPSFENSPKINHVTPFLLDLRRAFPIALFSGFSAFCYSASFLAIPCCTFHKNTLFFQAVMVSIDVILVWAFGKALLYRKKSDLFKSSLIMGSGIPLVWLFLFPSYTSPSLLQFLLILIGTMFSAPLFPYLYENTQGKNQYSILSWAYLLGSLFFGTLTPLLLLELQTLLSLKSALLTVTCCFSLITLLFLMKEKEEYSVYREELS